MNMCVFVYYEIILTQKFEIYFMKNSRLRYTIISLATGMIKNEIALHKQTKTKLGAHIY